MAGGTPQLPPTDAERPADNRRLRAEELQRSVDVARHQFLLLTLRPEVGECSCPAATEAALVDRIVA